MFDLSVVALIAALVVGMVFGWLLRQKRQMRLDRVTVVVIVVLIFSLGFSIGSNSELLESMPRIGLSAVVMTALAVTFSVVFVALARRKVKLG